MPQSLKSLLKKQPLAASAPCRIDTGGTWDIKALALPLEGIAPTTVNIALNLRTTVHLFPYKNNWIKISSEGFRREFEFHKDRIPFHPPFGLFFAATSYFGFHGIEVRISSQSPVKSALGGSSTALVALVKALANAAVLNGGKRLSQRDILHLGYHLEDGISGGNCGIQDQAAAVFGGVNQWKWHFGNRTTPFERIPLLDRKGQSELTNHLLVAYSGKSHVSSRTNQNWIKGFLSGMTRKGWCEANEIVQNFAFSLQEKDWNRAAGFLRAEMALRKKLTPGALIPVTARLIKQAERAGCGARFAGAGAGGSLWALGDLENIKELKKTWGKTVALIRGAKILDCEVDTVGVR
jgi:D-glycero-alpha-D-manno-heptose-7-phosphate kinase